MRRHAHNVVHTSPETALMGIFKLTLKFPDTGFAAFKNRIARGDERPRVLQSHLLHHGAPIGHDEPSVSTYADAE